MRAAISCLFSYLEGLVSALFELHRAGAQFSVYLPGNPDQCSLRSRGTSIARFLLVERGVYLPSMDLGIKLLQDILNHPSMTKDADESTTYDGTDVYGHIAELTSAESVATGWLDAACAALGYERFRDTERVCRDVARAQSGVDGRIREF